MDPADSMLAPIPQCQPLKDTQAQNAAGGFSFVIDDMVRLRRFLILGSEGGTCYASERELGMENVLALFRLLAQPEKGLAAVELIRDVSVRGLAHKQGPTLLALAVCARRGDDATRAAAYGVLNAVCRIPTHLFQFVGYAQTVGGPDGQSSTGWGRRQRRAVSEWYKGMTAERLAFVGTKYAQRHGWSHHDLLLLAHVKPASPAHQLVQRFLVKGWDAVVEETVTEVRAAGEACPDAALAAAAGVLANVRALSKAGTGAEAAELLAATGLAREHVPGPLLSEPVVWQALLANMPPTALLRNLGKLSSVGVLAPGSDAVGHVVAKLDDHAALCRARVHPMAVLLAASTYSNGRGVLGKLQWDPVPAVLDSLDRAFYGTFAAVEPANQRVLVALDVSGSMCSPIMNTALSCSQASAAMALVTIETEPQVEVMCFSDTFQPLPSLHKGIGLASATQAVRGLRLGFTDCALPMLYALEHELFVDLFVVYTDNETWFGNVHPAEALRAYREESGVYARLAVVGMTATEFSIADPDDAGMMDFVGFDASTPQALAAFARGEL